MTEKDRSHPLSRFLIIAAAIAVIVWSVSQAKSVLVSFLVSLFLAILAVPPLLWLERKRSQGDEEDARQNTGK